MTVSCVIHLLEWRRCGDNGKCEISPVKCTASEKFKFTLFAQSLLFNSSLIKRASAMVSPARMRSFSAPIFTFLCCTDFCLCISREAEKEAETEAEKEVKKEAEAKIKALNAMTQEDKMKAVDAMTLSEVGIVVLMLKQNIEENAALRDEIRSLKKAYASLAAEMAHSIAEIEGIFRSLYKGN